MCPYRPQAFALAAALALATLASHSKTRAADATLGLTDAITDRFSAPAELTDAEKPLLKFATEFTQWAAQAKASCGLKSCHGRTVRLDDDSKSIECEPTPVERLIAEGFPTGALHFHWELDPRNTPRFSFTLASYAARKPESDPRFVSGPRLATIEGVAMRFRDEGRFVSGVAFTR
jgi:hypothetical protein